jgi:hypothetical protein
MNYFKKYGLKFIVWLFFTASLISLVYRFSTVNNHFDFSIFTNNINNLWLFLIIIILMILNWTLEAHKWQISTKYIEPLNITNSLKGVFAGISVSLIFPNRTGEFLGKIMILKRENRIKGIFASMLSSLSQLFITLFLGSIGLFFFEPNFTIIKKYHYLFSYILLFLTIVIYFLIPFIIRKYPSVFPKKFLAFINFFRHFKFREIIYLVILSFTRYFVFLFQLYLLFMFFNFPIDIKNFIVLAFVSFLLTTIIPTTSFTELFIRSEVGLVIFSTSILSDEVIVSSFSLLWFVNIAIPAIIGLIISLKIKP